MVSATSLAILACLCGGVACLKSHELCTSGAFGSTPTLEGVQTLLPSPEPQSFKLFRQQESMGMEGLFAYPKAKLAMCTIEKNGCSTWETLWSRLITGNLSMTKPNRTLVKGAWSPAAADEVFRDPRAVRVIWVRDPLERFLSGFLNKCYVRLYKHETPNCEFGRGLRPGFPLSHVQSWLRAGNRFRNGHFAAQSGYCELKKRLHEYNLIGLMTSDGFEKNAKCILEQAGLSYLNEGADGRELLRHPLVQRDAASVLKKFFTKDFAYELMDYFKEDYDLFRLPRPTWVDEATGEWFNTWSKNVTPPALCSDEGLRAEDDVSLLAESAGLDPDGV